MKNIKTTSDLTDFQNKVLSAFKKTDTDVTISAIFLLAYGDTEWKKAKTNREMQQRLAPIFAQINLKLEAPSRIEPGLFKRTYRITTTEG